MVLDLQQNSFLLRVESAELTSKIKTMDYEFMTNAQLTVLV